MPCSRAHCFKFMEVDCSVWARQLLLTPVHVGVAPLWGFLMPVFGLIQGALLPEDALLVIQVMHLLVALAGSLAARIRRRGIATARSAEPVPSPGLWLLLRPRPRLPRPGPPAARARRSGRGGWCRP